MSTPEGEAPQAEPAPRAPKKAAPEGWLRYLVSAASGAAVLSALLALALAYSGWLPSNNGKKASAPAGQVEADFQAELDVPAANTELGSEWRAARSDHRIIARVIDRCVEPGAQTMSAQMFSVLLMDLRPDGDHYWRGGNGSGFKGNGDGAKDNGAAPTAGVATVSTAGGADGKANGGAAKPGGAADGERPLTAFEGAILGMSDAVARARVSAAAGADSFRPPMVWFGWLSVIVSAVATMLVALRASADTSMNASLKLFLGVLAVMFSTSATVLAGAKQFWDPTTAYVRNESAMLGLKQLHADVVLTFLANWNADSCRGGTSGLPVAMFQKWRNTLISLESGTMHASLTIPTQNGGGTLPTTDIGTDLVSPPPPAPAVAPPPPVQPKLQ